MEKERQEALEWFVNFANMDLNEMKPGDKAKFLIEAEDYLFPTKEIEEIPFLPSKRTARFFEFNKDIDRTKLIKSELGKMSWLVKDQLQRDSDEYWHNIHHLQDVMKKVLELPGFFLDSKREIQLSPGIRTFMWAGQLMIRMESTPEKFNLSYIPITGSHGEYIQLKFYRLLDGLPRSTISKCPGCDKFFLNTSLRKKRFCSSRCMWRVNAAKRREADPESYREYQKILMRDRYREKVGLKREKTKSRKTREKD